MRQRSNLQRCLHASWPFVGTRLRRRAAIPGCPAQASLSTNSHLWWATPKQTPPLSFSGEPSARTRRGALPDHQQVVKAIRVPCLARGLTGASGGERQPPLIHLDPINVGEAPAE